MNRFERLFEPIADDFPLRKATTLVLVVAATTGLIAGCALPAWQIALEPGQVLSGLVGYPADNPELRYQLNSWSLLNQVSGAALGLGLSERAISVVLSGLSEAVAFSGLALILLATARRPGLALIAPLAFVAARGSLFMGLAYADALVPTGGYGMFGMVLATLSIALLACREVGPSLFVGAVTFAVHPSIGVWLAAVLMVTGALNFLWISPRLCGSWRWSLAGVAVVGVSFAVYQACRLPSVADIRRQQYFDAFISLWEIHRRPFPLWSAAMAEIAVTVGWGLILIRLGRDSGRRVVGTAILCTAVFGLLFSAAYWFPSGPVQRVLLMLMPSRLTNMNLILGCAVAGGVLATRAVGTERLAGLAVVLPAMAGLVFSGLLPVPQLARLDSWLPGWRAVTADWAIAGVGAALLSVTVGRLLLLRSTRSASAMLTVAAVAMISGAAWIAAGVSMNPAVLGRYSIGRGGAIVVLFGLAAGLLWASRAFRRGRRLPAAPRAGRGNDLALGVVCAAFVGILHLATIAVHRPPLADRTNHAFWSSVASRPGMLLVSPGLFMVQLRSRRPVLLNPYSLDYLPFVPGTGEAIERILREIYGIDFFDPPPHLRARPRGGLHREDGRRLWESRSRLQWAMIGRRHGVTDVMTEEGWRLQLPVVARGEGQVLYAIPPAVTR